MSFYTRGLQFVSSEYGRRILIRCFKVALATPGMYIVCREFLLRSQYKKYVWEATRVDGRLAAQPDHQLLDMVAEEMLTAEILPPLDDYLAIPKDPSNMMVPFLTWSSTPFVIGYHEFVMGNILGLPMLWTLRTEEEVKANWDLVLKLINDNLWPWATIDPDRVQLASPLGKALSKVMSVPEPARRFALQKCMQEEATANPLVSKIVAWCIATPALMNTATYIIAAYYNRKGLKNLRPRDHIVHASLIVASAFGILILAICANLRFNAWIEEKGDKQTVFIGDHYYHGAVMWYRNQLALNKILRQAISGDKGQQMFTISGSPKRWIPPIFPFQQSLPAKLRNVEKYHKEYTEKMRKNENSSHA